jgi:glutamine synthetase
LLKSLTKHIGEIREATQKMEKALDKAHHADSVRDEADIFCNKVKVQMETIREATDELESMVDDQYWPLVKYRELLRV